MDHAAPTALSDLPDLPDLGRVERLTEGELFRLMTRIGDHRRVMAHDRGAQRALDDTEAVTVQELRSRRATD